MVRFLRALSPKIEFTFIVLVAFGPFILSSAVHLLWFSGIPAFSNRQLISLTFYEPVMFLVLCGVLRLRGWTLQRLGFGKLGPWEVLTGIGLFGLVYVVYVALWTVAWHLAPSLFETAANTPLVQRDFSLTFVILVSLINPVFEEVLVSAYVISALEGRREGWLGVHVSVGLRLAYHVYQGMRAIFSVIPVGLVFAIYFTRTRKIWPIIVAHAMFDFYGLLPYLAR
jgi:membrane protease YdiL (CAAX protease family)